MSLQPETDSRVLKNFLTDYLDNIVVVLNNYNRVEGDLMLNVAKITTDDLLQVGSFPVIIVTSNGHKEEALSLGKDNRKYKLTLRAGIWYFHEVIGSNLKTREVVNKLGLIASIIRENPTINGFCIDTNVMESAIYPRIRGDMLLNGGVVNIESEKIIRQTLK